MRPEPASSKRLSSRSRISRARLDAMIEEVTVDAYGESEQATGWLNKIEQELALPFMTTVLGAAVRVTKVDMRNDGSIVAICVRGRQRQAIPILDLPLPTPRLEGSDWIEAYRLWLGGC